jgi:phage-related minor tail protein
MQENYAPQYNVKQFKRKLEVMRLRAENCCLLKEMRGDEAPAWLANEDLTTRRLRAENSRLRNIMRGGKADALLERENEVRRLTEDQAAALLERDDEVRRLREENCRLRSDNAALTGGMAAATRLVEVKKEFNVATVERIQKVRPQQPDSKSERHLVIGVDTLNCAPVVHL